MKGGFVCDMTLFETTGDFPTRLSNKTPTRTR